MPRNCASLSAYRLALVFLAVATASCSTAVVKDSKSLSDAANKFDSAVKAAQTSLDTEIKAKSRIRRFEAIEYYIQTKRFVGKPSVAVIPDITGSDQLGSFARYVCAGSASLLREKSALKGVASYSGGLKEILDPGTDTLSGQYARFKALNEQDNLDLQPQGATQQKDVVQKCADDLVKRLTAWRPAPTTDTYDESPFAIITAGVALKNSIADLLKGGLNEYNNLAAKEKFSKYMNKYHPQFLAVMSQDMPEATLNDSWNRRIVVSLNRPFQTFKKIFKTPQAINPEDDDDRIRNIGMKVNDQLSEYDALQASTPPVVVRNQVAAAEDQLYKLAQNKDVTISEIIDFLVALESSFESIKTQYDAANKAASTFSDAIGQ